MSAAAVPSTPTRSVRPLGLKLLAISLLVNLVGPWLIVRVSTPYFSKGSAIPLLLSMLAPFAELIWNYAQRRTVDTIAVIVLSQLVVSLVINLSAHSLQAALIGHALQPLATGLVFAASVLIGRPLMVPLARTALTGNDPDRQARFDGNMAQRGSSYRQMSYITLCWAGVFAIQTTLQLLLTRELTASSYMLAAGILTFATPALLVWLSLSYARWRTRPRPGILVI